ncbi:hypothetical protein EE612_028529 [Oryza sativa]|nr:hypothetical protein EE612_028529 [Oryza sativa]
MCSHHWILLSNQHRR